MIQTLHIVPEYNEELIYPAICKSMEALNIAADFRPEMKIVIKPNLVMAKSPDFPATTHPLVIKAVIRWLREQGMQHITIAESSGGLYNAEAMKHVYHVCGMDTLGEGAELNMDFSAQTVNCPAGFKNHSFHLITPIVEADYIINICKLKTHAMTGYSGGIKNLFGTIPGLEKPQMHYRWPEIEDFSNMLLELAQTVAPNLTVIDAIDAMEGNGPTGGTSHPLHMLLAAKDFYTQDCFAAKLMGLEPTEIVMLRQALEKGLVDFAVVTTPVALKKPLQRIPLYSFREILIGGEEYAETASNKHCLQDLQDIPLIGIAPGSSTRELYTQYFMRHNLPFSPDMEVATTDQIFPMVQHNLGIGFFPEELAAEHIAQGKIVQIPIEEPLPERKICLIRNVKRPQSIAARSLEEHLTSHRETE